MSKFKKIKVGGSNIWTLWEKKIKIGNNTFKQQYLAMNNIKKSVMVLPITKNNQIVFVKKFCAPDEKWELVLPGGRVENNLSIIKTAKKELLEETAFRCRSIKRLGQFKILPAYLEACTYGFLATGLMANSDRNIIDLSEHLKIIKVDFEIALQKIKSGYIKDARSIAIILYYSTFVRD